MKLGDFPDVAASRGAGPSDAQAGTPAPDVSVVVPLFRNAGTLSELCQRLTRVFEAAGLSCEVILVDDCSPDGTPAEAERLVGEDARLGLVTLDRNVGQHRAVLVGLAHARGSRAVVLDGDLQDPPEFIPTLLARAQEGFDAVFAGRRGRYQSRHRTFTSFVYKSVQHLLCGVPRDAGMFIVLSKRLVERLVDFGGSDRLTVPTMIGLSGLPCVSVPMVRPRRLQGRSSYSSLRRFSLGIANILAILRWRCLPTTRTESTPRVGVARRLGACRREAWD